MTDQIFADCLKEILRYVDAEKFPHAKQDIITILWSIVLSAKFNLTKEMYDEKE